ncbi:MAG TPA: FG-GAP-like repeat-containing protein [Candidatus Sulfotelmatobacter sp.]
MKSSHLICTLALFTCAAIASQAGSVPSQPRNSVAMALDPAVPAPGQATVAADFNGDGKLDLATTNNKNGGLTIRLGKGDGTFLPAITYRAGYHHNAIVAADFNGDGKIDLAVSLPTLCGACGGFPNYQLQVYLGVGDGTFNFVAPKYPFYGLPLVAADFNGDGKADLIVTNTDYYGDDWEAQIMISKGDGTFEKGASLADTFYPTYPAVGDLNGDGKLDIALPALDEIEGLPITYIFLGNGDGTFSTPASYAGTNYYGFTAALGDFNGDGKLDIATDAVQVLLNNGDGTFTNDASVNVRGWPGGVVTGDFNGDGKIDIATENEVGSFPESNLILLGNDDGTFQTVTVEGGSQVLQAADFNRDGKLDLLTAGGIYLQTPAAVLPTYLYFGSIPVNTKTAPQTATLTNVGNVAMTIETIQVIGSSAYSQTNNCGATLAAGKSCQFQLSFEPTSIGSAAAALSVTVPGAPSSTVQLSGAGQ